MRKTRELRRNRRSFGLETARFYVPVSLSTLLTVLCGRRLWGGLVYVLKRPVPLTAAVLGIVLCRIVAQYGLRPLLTFLVMATALLGFWRYSARASVSRHLASGVRGAWRRQRVYRSQWEPAVLTARLDVRLRGTEYVPRLGRVLSTGSVDLVRVRMLPGQTLEDWSSAAPRLAQTFGALECRVRSVAGRVHDLVLWFVTADPLSTPIPAFLEAESVDLAAVPVAMTEDRTVFALQVANTHVLVGGETGSGKGSVLWSVVAGLGPGIRRGLVQVWAVDPKGGMELAFGAPLFARFAYGEATADGSSKGTVQWQWQIAALLDEAVVLMQSRASASRGVTRSHIPTVNEPLIVILVDELASLTSYVTDRAVKAQLFASLSLLLSQGRAVGVSVVGATQDARKEVLGMRDLFPTRIALRTAEAEQADLILGAGARNRGAWTDRIAASAPGVGYVKVDGTPEPVRVRFTNVTDADIDDLVTRYRLRTPSTDVCCDGPGGSAQQVASDGHLGTSWPEQAA